MIGQPIRNHATVRAALCTFEYAVTTIYLHGSLRLTTPT